MASSAAILAIRIVANASDAARGFRQTERDAERLQRRLNAINSDKFVKATSNVGKFAGAVSAVSLLMGPAGAAIAAFAVATMGVFATLASVAGAAFAAIKLGMDGIKKAAQVTAPALTALKTAISDKFATAMVPGFRLLSGLLTAIKPQMVGLAGVLSGVFNNIAGALSRATPQIQQLIDNAGKFFTTITPGINAVINGFLKIGTAGSSGSGSIIGLAQKVNEALVKFGNWLGSITPQDIENAFSTLATIVTTVAGAIRTVVAAFNAIRPFAPYILALVVAVKAISIAIGIWTAAQTALNIVMMANPVVLIVMAIIALIAIIVLVVQKTIGWGAVWEWIKGVALAVVEWIKSAWSAFVGFLSAIWARVKQDFTTVWNAIKAVASAVWNAIKTVIQTQINAAKAVVQTAINIIKGVFNSVKAVGTGAFNAIKAVIDGVGNAISTVIGWIQSLIGWLGNISWPSPPGWLTGLFGSDMGAEFKAVPSGVDSFLRFLPEPHLGMASVGPELTAASMNPSFGRVTRGGGPSVSQTVVNITIEGALDPVAVGRQVEKVVNKFNTTVGNSNAVRW